MSAGADIADVSDVSFPRRRRLLNPQAFAQVFAQRRSLRGEFFQLSVGPAGEREADHGSGARLGIVVAKKLARRAVARNRIKRQAREAFRHRCRLLPAMDLVLRLARPLPEKSWDALRLEVRKEIEGLLAKLT